MSDRVKGLLVSNSFLNTEKFAEHVRWFLRAADGRGITLDAVKNSELFAAFGFGSTDKILKYLEKYSFVIYWDKDMPLGRYLSFFCDELGIKIYNSVEAIAVCDDKSLTYERLAEWNQAHTGKIRHDGKKSTMPPIPTMAIKYENSIPLIPTVAAPMTYPGIGYTNLDFLENIAGILCFPMVVKECFGSFGMQVYLVNSMDELVILTKKLAGKPILFQKFIAGSAGKDVRLEVVGGEVVAAMYRHSVDGDFRANITNGAKMEAYTPSQTEKNLAVRTVQALGLDFAGVDLLFSAGSGDADMVCEVNSNAHFKNIHTCTGADVADKILAHCTGGIF